MTAERPEGQPNETNLRNVSPIEAEAQAGRGWKVELNGEPVADVSSLRIINERMGLSMEYGKTPAGYDGLALEEPGGGGAVTIPFLKVDGEVYIGMVEENRPFSGGMVLNVPRGFMDPGETHFETARRELVEETGYEPLERRIVALEGDQMNPNSTYFVTDTPEKGVKPYKVAVREDEVRLVQDADNSQDKVYEFNPNVLQSSSRMGERVMKSKFYHWTKAMQVKDIFTVAGVGRLVREEVIGH